MEITVDVQRSDADFTPSRVYLYSRAKTFVGPSVQRNTNKDESGEHSYLSAPERRSVGYIWEIKQGQKQDYATGRYQQSTRGLEQKLRQKSLIILGCRH